MSQNVENSVVCSISSLQNVENSSDGNRSQFQDR